jgi:cardiolipin synthase
MLGTDVRLKMFKALYKIVFSRLFALGLLIAFQLFWVIYLIVYLGNYSPYISLAVRVIAFIIVFVLLGVNMDAGFKMSWIIFILTAPIIGVGLFIMLGNSRHLNLRIRKNTRLIEETSRLYYDNIDHSNQELGCEVIKKEVSYLKNNFFAAYRETAAEFYPSGEAFKEALLDELRAAKNFIFLEYFIIKEGEFWTDILTILKQKAEEGLDVRVIYDDFGCAMTLKRRYNLELERFGIKTVVFNKLTPFFSTQLHNRDHRKIAIIDGDVGFTGGVNIGDEYVNVEQKFGHWKDSAVKLIGPGVWGLTVMFLQSWNIHRREDDDYEIYRPSPRLKAPLKESGLVIPYGSTPLNHEAIGRNVYVNMINQAKKYIYATTPYLILDNETRDSLVLAAKNGIDVRIITPSNPDKKIVNFLTKDNYRSLLEAGVKIYEYSPGFIHAKQMIVDDVISSIGTVNLDYRSFYHHFECGTLLANNLTVIDMRNDFLKTLENCKRIKKEDAEHHNIFKWFIVLVLRLVSPLM